MTTLVSNRRLPVSMRRTERHLAFQASLDHLSAHLPVQASLHRVSAICRFRLQLPFQAPVDHLSVSRRFVADVLLARGLERPRRAPAGRRRGIRRWGGESAR
ncbi:hypothetical protein [Actinoplanes teichomyceticus]|uniref:hypothetical protein n=1 Tax=Actinoplanes teichomyceticus TaxID=1867 RepID=UPI0011A5BB02|nr:hypothetical protein [Actinoplanes teichomyceticus]